MPTMAASDGDAASVRPWRLAAFVTSLGLTLTAAVASVIGGVAAAPMTAVSAADERPDRPTPIPAEPAADGDFWAVRALAATAARLRASAGVASVDPPGSTDLTAQLPRRSGHGRRVVFDQSAQRVWLVREGGSVRTTYLVSGSRLGNLSPGDYEVYSRSSDAVSFNYESTMNYMVRFTQGDNAAIGFHDIPIDEAGRPIQTVDQLGTAQSSGCIRQRPRDARQMWDFASLGTDVMVVA